jgi:hypothetical protein
MNRIFTPTLSALMFAAAVLAAQAALPSVAHARDRSATATGPAGNTATRNVSRANGDVTSSTTTSGGKTASRTVDRSGEGKVDATLTGPNGNTATRSTTRSETGSNTTVTGPNGQSGSVVVKR